MSESFILNKQNKSTLFLPTRSSSYEPSFLTLQSLAPHRTGENLSLPPILVFFSPSHLLFKSLQSGSEDSTSQIRLESGYFCSPYCHRPGCSHHHHSSGLLESSQTRCFSACPVPLSLKVAARDNPWRLYVSTCSSARSPHLAQGRGHVT